MRFWRRIFGHQQHARRPTAAGVFGPPTQPSPSSSAGDPTRCSAEGGCSAFGAPSFPALTRRHPRGTAACGDPAWFQILQAHLGAVQSNDKAIGLFREGRLDDAIVTLQSGLQTNTHYATGYSNLGFLYLRKGGLDQATACLLRALEADPRHPDAPNHLVDVLHGLIEELVQIGFNEGFLALYPGAPFDHYHRHRRAREIGKLIVTIGAKGVVKVKGHPLRPMQLVQLAMSSVQQQMCDHRHAVNLALAWEGLDPADRFHQ